MSILSLLTPQNRHISFLKDKKEFPDPTETGTIPIIQFSFYHSNHLTTEYNIHNWPVPYANECHLASIKDTHDVEPLPAYDIKGNRIRPTDYEDKLAGAVARVCFSIVHYIIKEKHIYNALVKDITVVRPPTTIASTSLKHILHSPKKKKI